MQLREKRGNVQEPRKSASSEMAHDQQAGTAVGRMPDSHRRNLISPRPEAAMSIANAKNTPHRTHISLAA